MDIIEKLKKEKKVRSVFDMIAKNKTTDSDPENKPNDIEVRELHPVQPIASESESAASDQPDARPVREFRTEGMHEFDIESLGSSSDGAIRIEYKTRISKLIDTGQFDEAISLLEDLKSRLKTSK
jgi:hypothetical protein